MAHNAPGRHYREGITLMQLADMFPDEAAARTWFEGLVWPDGRYCPRCGSTRTHEASHAKSPYRCTDCRSYFSVKAGTLAEASKVPLRKWVFAIYLESVRRLYVGLQSFRSMSRMDASLMKASALRLRFSQSLASRRQRLSQAMVRSTTQRLGWTTKPFTRSDRLTISVSRSGRMPARAR